MRLEPRWVNRFVDSLQRGVRCSVFAAVGRAGFHDGVDFYFRCVRPTFGGRLGSIWN